MERFFILCLTPRNTETVFEVVNGFFYIHTDFVGGIPFIRAADSYRVSTEVLFRINVDHSSAGGCTGILTMADTFRFFCCFVIFPFHLGTNKLHGRKAAA